MSKYCTCKHKEIEEIERGEYCCLNCEKEIEACDIAGGEPMDEPEPSEEEAEFYQDAGMQQIEREIFA